MGHPPAVHVVDRAGAIEYQLVLAAHCIQIGDEQLIVHGASGDHLFFKGTLARVKGRGVDVHDQLGAGLPLYHHWPHRIPDILTYVDSHPGAIYDVNRAGIPSSKITVFIEDPIVGKLHFLVSVDQLPVVADGRRVGGVGPNLDIADDHGDTSRGSHYLLHGLYIGLKEGGLKKQVFRRIAGYR